MERAGSSRLRRICWWAGDARTGSDFLESFGLNGARKLMHFAYGSCWARDRSRRSLRLEPLEQRLLLATFNVNSVDDLNDGVCDGSHCSLREAIIEANSNLGADTIHFVVGGAGVPTVRPTAELPTVTDPLTIDGSSHAAGMVELDGSLTPPGSDGLVIVAGDSTVRGLVINRFPARGIVLARQGGNRIEHNYIGTDVTATQDLGNGLHGVLVIDTSRNTIGGDAIGSHNVISGNGGDGVQVYGTGTRDLFFARPEPLETEGRIVDPDGDSTIALSDRNAVITVPGTGHDLSAEIDLVNAPRVLQTVSGDFIAEVTVADTLQPDAVSTVPGRLPFNGTGILLWQDAENYVRFERAAFHRDGQVTSYVLFELREQGQVTQGRSAGVNPGPVLLRMTRRGDHVLAVVNQGDAVWVPLDPIRFELSDTVEVGVAAVNTASTEFRAELEGFHIFDVSPWVHVNNRIAGNLIGTDATGTGDLGNSWAGVAMVGSQDSEIGGRTPAARNLISGNEVNGVRLAASATRNTVQGNFIGTDTTGQARLGNDQHGVSIWSGSYWNVIGTDGDGIEDATEGNVISGNGWSGVGILGLGTDGNLVAGNLIGVDATGLAALANAHAGVSIYEGAKANVVGAPSVPTAARFRNVISANGWGGVHISGPGTDRNVVAANFVGTDKSGTAAIGNAQHGIAIYNRARSNRVGTDGDGSGDAEEGNIVSGNRWSGIGISDAETESNVVAGNLIGTDLTGSVPVGNIQDGVVLYDGAASNLIGAMRHRSGRNVISGNGGSGVQIVSEATRTNTVAGNFIGIAADGVSPLGNGRDGILIANARNNFISNAPGYAFAQNVISGNRGHGIQLFGPAAARNDISGNYIGTDASGLVAVGNSLSGVFINGASDNSIGDRPNLISGNGAHGVEIVAGGALNRISDNLIGTDWTGSRALPNALDGVALDGAFGNTIGGTAIDERNVISGNGRHGVSVTGRQDLAGAIGWWQAEGNANDSIGDAHGTLHHGAGFSATGRVHQGFMLDGVDDYVELGRGASLSGLGAFSVEAWIRTWDAEGTIVQQRQADSAAGSGFNGEYVLSVGNILGAGSEGHVCWVTFGDNEFGFQICSQRRVNDVNYHHIVGIREPDGTGKIYIDGVLDNVQAAPPRTLRGELGVFVGGDVRDNLHYLAGEIDEIVIYDRALQSDEILRIANSGSARRDGNTILGNYIGTDATGTQAIGNSDGVYISDASDNVIGGTAWGARNLISGNRQNGVIILGTDSVRNRIEGNWIGSFTGKLDLGNGASGVFVLSSHNVIGGLEPKAGNLISGNESSGVAIGGMQNVVQGNWIGTDQTGTEALGNGGDGVVTFFNSALNTIGGPAPGARNVISGNSGAGVHLLGDGHTVQGNLIGTNAAGTAAIGNGDATYVSAGVVLNGAVNSRIGGREPGAGNVISGNTGHGIRIFSGAAGNVVEGNRIGVGLAALIPLGNGQMGMAADSNTGGNLIGGLDPAAANIIAFNGQAGIGLNDWAGEVRHISIWSNSIFSNGGLGIDLGVAGVTANDRLDRDGGGNGQQNYPVLKSIKSRPGQTTIRGSLNSAPNAAYRVEFFASNFADGPALGEGRGFIGAVVVGTNKKGVATITANLFVGLIPGQRVTATATDSSGSTSEFSAALRVPAPRPGRQRTAAATAQLDAADRRADERLDSDAHVAAIDEILSRSGRVRSLRRAIDRVSTPA